MHDAQTIFDLVGAMQDLDGDVEIAADASLATPDIGTFPLARGWCIDIAEAIRASSFARSVMANPIADPVLRLRAVRTAILLARPATAQRMLCHR